MFMKSRGSVTVFLCIVLTVVITLGGLLIDLARYNMAKKQVETALRLSVESILAAYDCRLREQYCLFSMYPRNKSALKDEIYDLLSRNLNVGTSVDGTFDLYGFNVGNIDVIQFYNLSEPDVLQQQVAEFMKYRAPVQVMQELYEKIKLMTGLMKEAKIIEKKIELDRLMNDIRENLVYIHYMINDKLTGFNTLPGSSKTLKDSVVDTCKTCDGNISSAVERCNNAVEKIRETQDKYIENYPQYETAKREKEAAEAKFNSIKIEMENIEKEIAGLSARLETETYHEIENSIIRRLDRLNEKLEELSVQRENAQREFDSANDKYKEINDKMTEIKNELDRQLHAVAADLLIALSEIESMKDELDLLLRHLEEHKKYNEGLLELIKETEGKLRDLDAGSSEIKMMISERESAVSDRTGEELKKQLKYFEKKTYSEISSQLEANLKALDKWINSIETYINDLDTTFLKIYESKANVAVVAQNPQDENNRFKGVDIETGFEKLKEELGDLKVLGEMDGVYGIPEFELIPKPVDEEKKAFDRWFSVKYEGASPQVQNESDNSELEKIKSNAKSLSDIMVYGSDSIENKDENMDKDQDETALLDMTGLPSSKGATSSDEAILAIAEILSISELNKAINEVFPDSNPLEEPARGTENINEQDKNYFNFEVERIIKLFDLITEAFKDGVEEIAESLYMNEYIVSAFKCATTVDNKIEHDIGWNRPLDKTFFKNAEVEYILFGNPKESANINWSKASVFSIRLVFNLLHVYTSPEKLAQTLTLATAIAGWTIFGVPVVQNFLLILWAAAESYFDMHVLFNGGRVPLIKTSSSWKLDLESLGRFVAGEIIESAKDYAKNQLNNTVDNITASIEETIEGIIDAKVDKVFAPFETGLSGVTNMAADSVEGAGSLIGTELSNLRSKLNFNNADDFAKSLDNELSSYVSGISERIRSLGQDTLKNAKERFKGELKNSIFQWGPYKDMVLRIKNYGNDLIDKGFDAAAEKIENTLGAAGKSLGDNITGRLVMMDYPDYLRLMLFAVPKEKKALRTADLIQVNMKNITGVNHSIDNYCTYLFVRAEVDFKPWFLPAHLFKKENSGMISVAWSQGY